MMGTMLNQYSFLIIVVMLLGIITIISWRLFGLKYVLPVIGLTSVLLVATQLLLSTNTNPYSSIDSFDNALASGKPVLLELYSNF